MRSFWACLSLVVVRAALAAEPLPPPTIMGAYILGAVAGCGKTISTAEANALAASGLVECRAARTPWQQCAAALASQWCASH